MKEFRKHLIYLTVDPRLNSSGDMGVIVKVFWQNRKNETKNKWRKGKIE